jgi:hypothetical protein
MSRVLVLQRLLKQSYPLLANGITGVRVTQAWLPLPLPSDYPSETFPIGIRILFSDSASPTP